MRDKPPSSPEAPPTPGVNRSTGEVRRIRSDELFGRAREIIIDHDGRAYQLRVTQNGRLILTA